MPKSGLEVEGLLKSYGERRVLLGVDLTVGPGQVLALLGPNGAGKTTLISIASGLLLADAGRVRIAGFDLRQRRRQALAHLGLAPQETGVYPTLSVRQNLEFVARLNGVPPRRARDRAAEVADAVGLAPLLGRRASDLSGGERRRLHTAMAFVHRPGLLFLDEPTVGADVAARSGLLELVRDLAANGTSVLYTTHYLSEVEQLGADVAILHQGRIAVSGSLGDLVPDLASTRVTLSFEADAPGLSGWRAGGRQLVRDVPGAEAAAVVAHALAELAQSRAEVRLAGVDIARPSLENAYLAVTGERPDATQVSEHDRAA